MSLPSLRSLGIVAILAAVVSGRPAVAQGLLHKHAHRPLGVPMALPGQQGVTSAASASATAAVATVAIDPSTSVQAGGGVPSPGAAPGGPAVVAIAPGADLTVDVAAIDPGGAVGDGMICVMPLPDGQPGHPHVFHSLKPGATDGSPGMLVGPPLFDTGVVDPGLGDMASIMPRVDAAPDGAIMAPVTAASAAPGVAFAHHNHPDNRGMMTAASRVGGQAFAPAASDASGGGGGQARLGGFPNRAAGMRTDALTSGPPHARGAASGHPSSRAAPGADDPGTGTNDATVRHASAAEVVRSGAGQARVPVQAATAPRWRDRLRFAWPTTK